MTSVRRGAVAVLAVLAASCGGPEPTSPTIEQPPELPVEKPERIAGARTFVFDGELGYPVRGYTTRSSFVLHDSGSFELRYSADLVYRGTYKESGGAVDFAWEGWSTIGGTTGTIVGDVLTVRYNLTMTMADFEDARYKLLR